MFYLKESIESYTKRRQKATGIIDSRVGDTQGMLGFSGPKTFWSVVTQGMFVKQSIYNRILIDYTTNCTSTNVQTKIKLKP